VVEIQHGVFHIGVGIRLDRTDRFGVSGFGKYRF
jgi:hypothetical protein